MNTRQKVLEEALKCVNGEREKQYGSPEDNFRRIADLWSTYLTSLFEDEKVVVDIDPIDVAKMMILFKIARSNGDKDKMDNYVDMIGYASCAAEIFENGEHDEYEELSKEIKDEFSKRLHTPMPEQNIQVADECRVCDYAEKCMGTGVCLKEKEKELLDKKNPYAYFHDKLANYVAIKANEEQIPLDNLKSIDRKFPRELEEFLDQAATDCAENGKRILDCYKEIDELFAKYVNGDKKKDASFWKTYNDISTHIAIESYRANINVFDVVDRLTRNGHAPIEMAALLVAGKLNFDDIASYVEDTINKVKLEGLCK